MSQQDLRTSNNAALEVAIASFFKCCNIPFKAARSPHFHHMLHKARLVGSDFKPTDPKKIGGELLDLNFNECQEKNRSAILREAGTFGLCWINDGATVKRMPLQNVLCLAPNIPPTVVPIIDCFDHLKEGRKKDAVYISNFMKDVVKRFDEHKVHTDLFFFDGAANVRKGGEIL